jgi:hypothetical protein
VPYIRIVGAIKTEAHKKHGWRSDAGDGCKIIEHAAGVLFPAQHEQRCQPSECGNSERNEQKAKKQNKRRGAASGNVCCMELARHESEPVMQVAETWFQQSRLFRAALQPQQRDDVFVRLLANPHRDQALDSRSALLHAGAELRGGLILQGRFLKATGLLGALSQVDDQGFGVRPDGKQIWNWPRAYGLDQQLRAILSLLLEDGAVELETLSGVAIVSESSKSFLHGRAEVGFDNDRTGRLEHGTAAFPCGAQHGKVIGSSTKWLRLLRRLAVCGGTSAARGLRRASVTISGLNHLRNSFPRGPCFRGGARLQLLRNCLSFRAKSWTE